MDRTIDQEVLVGLLRERAQSHLSLESVHE